MLNGADPNQQNRQGCTPLFFVRSKRILKVLLRAGADPLKRNRKGQNAFEFLRQADQLGENGWEFEMKDILLKAMDSMKVRRYKEGKGEYEDDDGLSSLNSAAGSARSQVSHTASLSIDKTKSKLNIENKNVIRSQSAKDLKVVERR